MNQDSEDSSSSQPASDDTKAKYVEALLKECKKLREQVESVKNVHTLTFYSRLVSTAYDSIKTIIHKFNTTYPTLGADDIKACEYYRDITCDLSKEIIAMFVNAVMTRSPASERGGDSRKITMWKKQCDKNMDKIESLIKNTILLGKDSTWFEEFWLYGIFHGGVSGVLSILLKNLMMKDTIDEDDFKFLMERGFKGFEMCYKELISVMLDRVREGIEEEANLSEESCLNNPVEEEHDALKKLQEDDTAKRFCEAATVGQMNLEAAEVAQAMKISRGAEISNELQDVALKKIQEEDDALNGLQVEGALNEQQIVEETQKNLQEDEEMKNLAEEKAFKNLHEEDTQKKLQEEESLKKLHEEEEKNELPEKEAMRKLQEETQKNSQETEVNKTLQEVSKKSQEEGNTGYKILKFGRFAFKMKNGVLERVPQ